MQCVKTIEKKSTNVISSHNICGGMKCNENDLEKSHKITEISTTYKHNCIMLKDE